MQAIDQIAEQHIYPIPAPINKKVLLKKDGSTRDIIAEVLQTYADSRNQLKQFGQYFKGATLLETCSNIWHFWKEKVKYKIDPEGVQWVKTPAAFWNQGHAEQRFGDCKSFSIACAASLHALDIKGAFRFVSFGANTVAPTHVLVVLKDTNGKEIIIDCVWHSFNSTKQWSKKWDYNMTAIYSISGIETNNDRGMLGVDVDNIEGMSAGELDLIANKMLLEVEQGLAVKRSGIGSTHDNAYEMEIAAYNNAISQVGATRGNKKPAPPVKFAAYGHAGTPKKRVPQVSPKKLAHPNPSTGPHTAAKKHIPISTKPQNTGTSKAQIKTNNQIKRNDAGKGISKKNTKKLEAVNLVVKKKKDNLVKKAAKTVTAPIRLTTKAATTTALRVTLPKNAPFFLYLFLVDAKDPVRSAKILSKAPDVVLKKRAKALQAFESIVKKIGMKEATFYTIVRAGIMKRYAASPEVVLAKWMTDANFQIGAVKAALQAAGSGVNFLSEQLGLDFKNMEAFAPDPSDWFTADSVTKEATAIEVKDLPDNNDVNTGKATVPDQTPEEIFKDNNVKLPADDYSPVVDMDKPTNSGGNVYDNRGNNTDADYGNNNNGGADDRGGRNYNTGGGQFDNRGNNADDATRDPFTGEESILNRPRQQYGDVAVTAKRKAAVNTDDDGVTKKGEMNTGLWILGGVAALAFLSGGSKSKSK